MIEFQVDVELKDTIMVAMLKLAGYGFYMCTIRVDTSGKRKQVEVSREEASNLNSFDALNSIENADDLGKLLIVDDEGKPLSKVVSKVNADCDSEVEEFESGGASGIGGCGDEEEGADHQNEEDEDGDGDT
uniref:Uncharacterized protein n=1 Tax=Tanacetum cinerariifolium TaxID=118510 RepID=A0A699JQS5_TANCI|nr:hypothetical protein [Tanacetum cinerariifolium]